MSDATPVESFVEPDDRFRVPPAADPSTEFFWASGAEGVLRFQCCTACGYFMHPPGPRCPACGSMELSPSPVSGDATIHSFTMNAQPWDGDATPYVVALVEMVEQVGLRLTTNLVGVNADEVAIGMPVHVVFEHRSFLGRGDIWFPLFTPALRNLTRYGPSGAITRQISQSGGEDGEVDTP